MGEALIITFRETLEAALIVGILLAYLKKTKNFKHGSYVWYGVVAGVLISVVLAFVFQQFLGGFDGKAEELYEGIVMLLAATLITWMILWMLNQRQHIKKNLEEKAQLHIQNDHAIGLFFLAFVGVAREGIETIIFLQAALVQSDAAQILSGGFLGIVIAIVLSILMFKGFAKIPLRKFFTATSLLLILFAAGLVAHGLHELQEAGIVPIFVEHVWDMNHILNEKGTIGGLFKGLFGYNGNPSIVEIVSYVSYLALIAGLWGWIGAKEKRA
ncbi:MAG: FTR1 family protein [bacterium]|nr:FTR1 family protein [bacterium]